MTEAMPSQMENRLVSSGVATGTNEILGARLKPGNNLTLSLANGVVTVGLDTLGDWTITVGLNAKDSDKTLHLAEQLGKLGYFHAAESGGVSYFLWTSAFEETEDAKKQAEQVLFNTLKTIQDNDRARPNKYIS